MRRHRAHHPTLVAGTANIRKHSLRLLCMQRCTQAHNKSTQYDASTSTNDDAGAALARRRMRRQLLEEVARLNAQATERLLCEGDEALL